MDALVRDHLGRHRQQITALLSVFVLGLIVGGALYWQSKLINVKQSQTIERLNQDKQKLLSQLAAAEVQVRVISSSEEQLRKTLIERENTIADHESSLEFYRQLMVVDDKKNGFDLSKFRISRTEMPDTYHFQFAFVQYAKQHNTLNVKVNIRLEGQEDGKVAIYFLRDLLLVPNPNFGQLSLKYFQMLKGDVQLPIGFKPAQMVVTTDSKAPWQRKLDWTVEE